MKDYIVFFTKGFDKHTIEKQRRVFENAFISCIDSEPDYNKLIKESQVAKAKGFDNFYIFWERNDVPDMNKEMVTEFKKTFHETGAIPYKYNKLSEGDVNGQQAKPAVSPARSPASPVVGTNTNVNANTNAGNPSNGNTGATNPVNGQMDQNKNANATNGNTSDEPKSPLSDKIWFNQETCELEEGDPPSDIVARGASVNLSAIAKNEAAIYAKNHTATVFIWPFNLFMCESYAQTAWVTFANAVKSDNVSRLPKGTTTANSYASKKGNWQRIIYIPQSFEALGQSVARSDTMFSFMREHLVNTPWQGTKTGTMYQRLIEDRVLGVGGSKPEFGNLTQSDIIAACKRSGATNADIRNIHIYYTPEYEPFMKWCPLDRKTCLSSVNFPKADKNKEQLQHLEAMKQFIYKNKNDANWLKALDSIYVGMDKNPESVKATTALRDLIKKQDMYQSFWTYWNLYLTQDDVYGRPDGKKSYGTKDFATDVIDKLSNKGDNLDDFRKLAGMVTADDLNKAKNDWADIKDTYNMVKGAATNAVGVAQNIMTKNSNNQASATPTSAPELEKSILNVGNPPSTIDGDDNNKGQEDNQDTADKDQNATDKNQNSENQTDDNENENDTANNNGGESISDLPNEVLDRLICQLSPEWSKRIAGAGISWVGHHFYSDAVFTKWEGVGTKDPNGNTTYVEGYTMTRANIVNAEINKLLKNPNKDDEAVDGQNPNDTNVPSNANVDKPKADDKNQRADAPKEEEEDDDSQASGLHPGEKREIKNSVGGAND